MLNKNEENIIELIKTKFRFFTDLIFFKLVYLLSAYNVKTK